MRALLAWLKAVKSRQDDLARRVERALAAGWRFLEKHQRADGSWLPLWFGNQYVADDENPLYGTAKVLLAWRDAGRLGEPAARRALDWLKSSQSADGGWGGAAGAPSSVEETALALEALLAEKTASAGCLAGLEWLLARVEDGSFVQTAPIGFYFAKLWYFERLYPIIFTVGALSRARAVLQSDCSAPEPMGTGRRTEEVIAAF
jgi:squalene-hopene/tetraprenyl-beta-curcumene cyclase